jgi:hypothetical protein
LWQEQYAAALTQAYETMQEMENPQKRRKKRGEDGCVWVKMHRNFIYTNGVGCKAGDTLIFVK